MAYREPGTQRDGFISLLGGVNSAVEPALLGSNEAAFLGNLSVRGGYPETRSCWRNRPLIFPDSEASDWFATHHFQGGDFYLPSSSTEPYFIGVMAGRVFRWSVDGVVAEITPTLGTTVAAAFNTPPVGSNVVVSVADASKANGGYPVWLGSGKYKVISVMGNDVTLLNISDFAGVAIAIGASVGFADPNNPEMQQVWTKQAEQWFFIQDGQSACIIWDGVKSVRADPKAQQVPTGTAMEYYPAIGRLAVAVNGNEIALSDINGTNTTSDLRYFKEEHDILGGGRFRVPRQYGDITALSNIANLDTTLGKGPLMVGTERSIFALNLNPDRTSWPKIDALQTVASLSYGPKGQNGIALVNGDMFYRAEDGMRSFIMARRDFGSWGNSSTSTEMDRILKKDSGFLLRYVSALVFDNRLLFTASPLPVNPYGWYFQGIVALDLNPVSTLSKKAPPIYDGLWTGLKVIQLVKSIITGKERAFAITKESAGIGFWELSSEFLFDSEDIRPVCWLESRAMKGASDIELKRINGIELWWDRVVGTVDVNVKYRPDQYPCWFEWDNGQMCSKDEQCQSDDACVAQTTFEPAYKTRMAFRAPVSVCETADQKPSDNGYTFEVRIQWTGRARLRKVLLKMETILEEVTAPDAHA